MKLFSKIKQVAEQNILKQLIAVDGHQRGELFVILL